MKKIFLGLLFSLILYAGFVSADVLNDQTQLCHFASYKVSKPDTTFQALDADIYAGFVAWADPIYKNISFSAGIDHSNIGNSAPVSNHSFVKLCSTVEGLVVNESVNANWGSHQYILVCSNIGKIMFANVSDNNGNLSSAITTTYNFTTGGAGWYALSANVTNGYNGVYEGIDALFTMNGTPSQAHSVFGWRTVDGSQVGNCSIDGRLSSAEDMEFTNGTDNFWVINRTNLIVQYHFNKTGTCEYVSNASFSYRVGANQVTSMARFYDTDSGSDWAWPNKQLLYSDVWLLGDIFSDNVQAYANVTNDVGLLSFNFNQTVPFAGENIVVSTGINSTICENASVQIGTNQTGQFVLNSTLAESHASGVTPRSPANFTNLTDTYVIPAASCNSQVGFFAQICSPSGFCFNTSAYHVYVAPIINATAGSIVGQVSVCAGDGRGLNVTGSGVVNGTVVVRTNATGTNAYLCPYAFSNTAKWSALNYSNGSSRCFFSVVNLAATSDNVTVIRPNGQYVTGTNFPLAAVGIGITAVVGTAGFLYLLRRQGR